MAVKASASITLSFMVDIKATYRYYKLQASTASAPSAPTAYPPSSSSGWDDTEPRYTSGSTNTLYFVDCTVLTNNSFTYSKVSVSSSYEAAKEAYNKAQNAQNTANSANSKIDNLEIGGRNLLLRSKGDSKEGLFSNFDYVGDYAEVTLSSKKSYTHRNLEKGFLIGCRDYEVGKQVTWSYDIMYTNWNFPTGSNRAEFWFGQRYTNSSDTSAQGIWRTVTKHNLPEVGSNGCELNKWFHVTKTLTIPEQASSSVGTVASIQFYNSNANVEASFTARFKNVKLEYGNKATDWTPAPEDVDSAINAKIASVDVEYYLSTSATSLSGGSWVTTAPTWVNGKYMWSRTKITNGAGTVTYKPSKTGTCIAGAKGDTGATGATGATGNGVKTVVEQYYKSTSATSLSGGSWSTTYPGWENGKYIWTRSVITYTNNSTTTTDAVCVTGQKGDTGATGKGVKSSAVTYQASTSGTTIPTGTWSTSIPSVAAGSYLWTRTIITYTDNSSTTSYSVGKMGDTGATGATGPQGPTGADGKGVKSTEITYQAWSNGTSTPTGTWSSSPPATSASKPYLWTRTIITYTDNSTSTSYSVGSTPEGIVVGGRNLLRNTDNLTKWVKESGISVTPDSDGWYKVTDSSHSSSKYGIYQDFSGYEQNTDYTVSLYLKNGSNAGNLSIGYGEFGSGVITGSSTKTKYSYTFNTGSNTAALRIYINLAPTAAGQNFYVKLPKLELGNKATDWTPAPEDVDSSIEDAKNEAAKTATNYIYYDITNGLQIGDKSSGKWEGTRAQIKADSYNILNQNGTELASFGANEVRLGNESKDATISMRKGSLNISNLNKGDYDYTQIGCKGNLDVSSEDYTSDSKYKKGGILTTIDYESLIEWQNLRNYKWSGLKSYTWDDLNGIEFVAQRDKYFETRLYSEERDSSSANGFNGARVSLKSSIGSGDNTITSEIDLQADKINLKGKIMLDYMMPVGYIFQWVPTNGGPDLSTADKVKAYYGFGTWEEISGRFLLGRSDSYGVGSTGGNETHTHTNPATGSTAITVDQMPSHVHELFANASFTVGNAGGTGLSGIPSNTSGWGNYTNAHWYTIGMHHTGGSQGHTHTMGSTGSTNSMPPYLSVYIWKRIA